MRLAPWSGTREERCLKGGRLKVWRIAISAILCVLVASSGAWADYSEEWLLGEPPEYDQEIGPVEVLASQHSTMDIYVQNILDPARWKLWEFEIYLVAGESAPSDLDVSYWLAPDYDGFPDASEFSIAMDSMGTVLIDDELYDGYRASAYDHPEWGTSPVGDPDPLGFEIGNPEWVGFSIDIDESVETSVWYYIHDECLPEPVSMTLLGLGGLALLRRKRRA